MHHTLQWLLKDSDPSVIYQIHRDLFGRLESECQGLRDRMLESGYVHELISCRKEDGHWGNGVYNPKWTCTHYVLYELIQLGVPDSVSELKTSSELLLSYPSGTDGGINYARTVEYSDVCINGMILTIASYFDLTDKSVFDIVDYLLKVEMPDGGFNCEYYRGASHSSLHTTISALEGLLSFQAKTNDYRKEEIGEAIKRAVSFILAHRLFRSDKTGEVIRDEFFKFSFPVRWKYDILRCLDLFRRFDIAYDERMDEALDYIENAASKNGTWKAASQAGKTYFVMEKSGSESKWNTLRALRVLRKYL